MVLTVSGRSTNILISPATAVTAKGRSVLQQFSAFRSPDTPMGFAFLLAVRATRTGRADWREK